MSVISVGRRALTTGVAAGQAWVAAETGYLVLLLAFAARSYPQRRVRRGDPLRVAVLVPAHDEEAVIEACVASLMAQDHPAARRQVIVVADNCSDRTAQRARAAGADVWSAPTTRTPARGRPSRGFERLLDGDPQVDAVAMIDADCVASPQPPL